MTEVFGIQGVVARLTPSAGDELALTRLARGLYFARTASG